MTRSKELQEVPNDSLTQLLAKLPLFSGYSYVTYTNLTQLALQPSLVPSALSKEAQGWIASSLGHPDHCYTPSGPFFGSKIHQESQCPHWWNH